MSQDILEMEESLGSRMAVYENSGLAEEIWHRFRSSNPVVLQSGRRQSRIRKLVQDVQEKSRTAAVEEERLQTGNILFLVDQSSYRQYIEKMLQLKGHEVQTTMRLVDCLHHLGKNPVDLLVLNLSGDRSFEIARKMKANNTLYDLPFVLCSDAASKQDLIAAHRINIKSWFVRPFRTDEFVEVVSEQVSLARQKQGKAVNPQPTAPRQIPDSLVVRGNRRQVASTEHVALAV